jgi:integrase
VTFRTPVLVSSNQALYHCAEMKVTVQYFDDGKRKAKWMVRFYEGSKPVRKFFRSRDAAERYATELREAYKSGMPPLATLKKCARIAAGTGYEWDLLVQAGIASLQQSNAIFADSKATFSDGAALVIARAKSRGRRPKTIRGYEDGYKVHNRKFGARLAYAILEREAQEYIDARPDRSGNKGKASPFTKKSTLRLIRMALRALGIQNPFPKLEVIIPNERAILHFTIDEVLKILGAARSWERGMVALLLFVGIRPETLERLPAENVNVVDQCIVIPAHLSKTHQPIVLEGAPASDDCKVYPGIPPIVWEWLRRYPFRPCDWTNLQQRLRRALSGKWIFDGLRHTAATYYRAKFGVFPTSELLGHTTTSIVRRHYAGPARRAQADEFFSLGPDSVPGPPDLNPHYRSKVSWPTDEVLADLVQKKPIRHIARELGCSDTLVFRRCRKLKIPMPGRGMWTLKLWNISWPADDQLARLVKEKSVAQIALELRCSTATVYERCKQRGILMPDRRLEKGPTEPGPSSLPAPEGQNPANPGDTDTKPTLNGETSDSQRESNPSDQIRDQITGFDSKKPPEPPETGFSVF